MFNSSLIKRKKRLIVRQSFIVFLVFMVTLSGMLPSVASITSNAVELPTIVDPKVSKDVDGENSKELIKGEDFNYNINIALPDDLSGYESMKISDDLDNNLTIQETEILINGDVTDTLVATEEGQSISLEINSEQLEELAGDELVLQIVSQVKEEAAEEDIENIAQVVINDNIILETNSAIVTLVKQEETEEEVTENPESEDVNDQADEPTTEDEESLEELKKESEAEEEVSKENVVKSNKVAAVQQQDTEGITINDTDSYLIGSGHILQLDGNDPSIEKGRVELDNSSITNSLALGKNEDVLYGNAALRLYKIYPDGQTEFITDLEGDLSPPAGAITPDGNEYVYLSRSAGDQLAIAFYNLSTGEKSSVPLQDKSGFVDLSGGDFAFDGEGNLWFSRWQDSPPNSALAKVDTQTGILESVIPVISNTGEPFSRSGSLSFLPNGKLLIQGNYIPGSHLLELDPATGIATEIVSTGEFGLGLQDAASRVYPIINPEVEITKSVSPTETVSHGEELTYTLEIQNNGNLASTLTTVTDELPDGTTYVSHSTTLNGQEVEDENGESPLFKGMLVNSPNETLEGVLYVGEENAATVTFKVTVSESVPSGTEILNVANVSYDGEDNIPSNEVTNIVEEIIPPNACAAPVVLVNPGFEEPVITEFYQGVDQQLVPGWNTTDQTGKIEVMNGTLPLTSGIINYRPDIPEDELQRRFSAFRGDQYIELQWSEPSIIYQDIETKDRQGMKIYYRFAHKGKWKVDTLGLRIGDASLEPYELPLLEEFQTDWDEWKVYTGVYELPTNKNQEYTRIAFEGRDFGTSELLSSNLLDEIFIGTEPCVDTEKIVSPEGEVYAGEELTYEITVKNSGGDVAADMVIEDEIPEGTEYVPGSMKILTGLEAGDLTDEDDEDAGHYADGKVTFSIGDLPNTTNMPDGVTVQFKVITLNEHAGEVVVNEANVKHKNLLTDEDHETPTNETETPVEYRDPELDSKKSAELEEKAVGNMDEDNPEVGDTLRYTITTSNVIEGSLVENLTIRDTIPEGLTYVDGSLEVDGVSVTDEEDDDAGHVVDGEITGNFGDITDVDEHSVTFLVTVDEGQAGNNIENIAEVKGDNTDIDEPEEEVKVYPRDPVLEAEKSAVNAEAGKEKFEVGDTIIYKIQTRNIVSDSLVEDLVITDELPVGLAFVEGSIEVSHDGEAEFTDGVVTATFGDVEDTEWRTVTFEAVIESGQSGKEIENIARAEGKEVPPVHPRTKTKIDPKDPELSSNKSAVIEEKAEVNTDADNPEVGDTLRYTITTRNTIEDSLVKNLVITDEVPEGLTYVEGSLEVDGVSVTDEADDDAGHVVDDAITGYFGDITDTDEHAVTFLVTVDEGQAGKDIENIAEVKSDNTDVDEPEDEVKVYPRDPVLEAEKLAVNAEAGKEKFEVGDTIIYTIQTRNIVSDSLVGDLAITDELPKGLTFVEGSIEVSHDGEAEFTDGTITASFGDVEDTEWRTVTFEAVIESGQSGKEIENTAQITSNGTEDPEDPTTTTIVDPKDPQLKSAKSSSIEEKAEGNTDAENVEVGDTLRYTITTRNTIEDSLVENLVITDEIPKGLTYVDGSVEANHDGDATYENGVITATYGNVTDTDVRSVTFLVTVDEGQAGKDIHNIAEVKGDNTEVDEPKEETEIHPRHPVLEAEKSAVNAEAIKKKFEVGDTIIYTIQTRNKVSDSLVEDLVIIDELPAGLTFVEGSIEVSHDGEAEFTDGTITARFGDVEDTEWRTVTFAAVIESGQSGKEIENTAQVTGNNTEDPEEPTTTTIVDPKDPQLESAKSSSIEEKAEGNTDVSNLEVGDILRYTIITQNTIEDSLVENLVISDMIPEGLTYVEGSLEVDGVSVTDVEDDDAGYVVDGKVTGSFGNITDTDEHTVTFLVTVDEGQAGKDIQNIAEVKGDNTTTDEPEEKVNIYPRHPVLESEKLAKNLEKGKETFEVGDTIVYTIKARNIVSDSLVKNLMITDKLPAGIEYVDGSLEVSHEGVGEFNDGKIIATFGDVTDQEWYTVTFQATINSDQSGELIKNVATVDAGNVTEPNQPEAKVLVEEKDLVTPAPEKTDPPSDVEKDEGQKLPKTATNTFNYVLLGIMAILVGLATLRIRKTNER